jgi:uncharacterized protein YjbI with pentapeptide repeats
VSVPDLKKVDLHGANLREARLRGANWRGVDLSEANLEGVRVKRERLAPAKALASTILTDGTVHDVALSRH